MKTKVSKLSLSSFRGATKPVEINFDISKPVALVFGENGTGKSTISDAFDFICNKQYGSLDDRSFSAQPKSYVTSLGQDPKQLSVSVITTTGNYAGTLAKDGPTVIPAIGCPEARILRRSKILQSIDAQPKQRFEALKPFFAVPGIDKSENALREAVKLADNSYSESVRSYTQAKTALEELWIAEGRPESSELDWASKESGKDLAVLRASVESINKILNAFVQADPTLVSFDSALADLTLLKVSLTTATEAHKAIEVKYATGNSDLLDLLKDANSYVIAHMELTDCPVCEQGVTAQSLADNLKTRIESMTELSVSTTSLNAAKQKARSGEIVATKARDTFCKNVKSLGLLLKSSTIKEVTDLGIDWTQFDSFLNCPGPFDEFEAMARSLWAAAILCRGKLSDRVQSDQKSVNQQNAIKGHYDTHAAKLKSANAASAISGSLNKALEIVSKTRKAYIEGVLTAISSEVERLYTKLHPGEGLGKLRFYLKQSAIGSLEFEGEFQKTPNIPPQAYYSESHLDTMGICVFIALAKHFITEKTIVILDDVLTSVDGPHLDRFMDLLHAEAKNLNQVIVTTHYRHWKDRYLQARGQTANTQIIELRMWDINLGVQTDEAVTNIQELRDCLTAPRMNRQAVASKSGIQLENILDYLTYQYRSRLPRPNDSNYTLGDLGSGLESKHRNLLVVKKTVAPGQGKIEIPLKTMIDDSLAQTWVRNQVGCHFNTLGSEVTDSEIKEFGQKVLVLSEAIICSKCECFPTRRPSGSYWQCECGDLELSPLIMPAAPLGAMAAEQ